MALYALINLNTQQQVFITDDLNIAKDEKKRLQKIFQAPHWIIETEDNYLTRRLLLDFITEIGPYLREVASCQLCKDM